MSRSSSGTIVTTICALVFFLIGAMAGVAGMVYRGYRIEDPAAEAAKPPEGPAPKALLTGLVTKLDQLTNESRPVELSKVQKQKVRELLKGLKDKPEIQDDEAKQVFDALANVLKDKKGKLEAIGFAWPSTGAAGGGASPFLPPPPNNNPFRAGPTANALKSLEKKLTVTWSI